MDEAFRAEMAAGYTLDEPAIVLGSPILGDEVLTDVRVQVAAVARQPPRPDRRRDRHRQDQDPPAPRRPAVGRSGVPVFAVDVKGDLSGVGAPGDAADPKVVDRVQVARAGRSRPPGHPLEVLSLSGKPGAHVRASVSSFGPLLLGKVLDLNDTQTSILSLVFRYCDDQHLPLLDLADLRTTLKFLGSDDGKAVLEDLGGISPASLGVILRAIVTIEQEGADIFFGEPEFDVDDLLRTTRRRPGDRDPARGRGRHGPAAAVLDVRAVDARPAVRDAARGRRPARSPSSRSSSTRRTCCSTTRPRRCWSRSSAPRG